MTINVVKRSGEVEPLMLEKWQAQIAKVCSGIADVSQSMIEIKASPNFYDGITTQEIDEITLRAIVNLIDVETNPDIGNVNYQYVAGKQRLSMLRKNVYGQYTPPHLYDIVKKNVEVGLYTPELLEWYTEDEWNKMNSIIEHNKDENYSYAAIEQLVEKYLVKNRATGQVYETPQVRYMVAAATVFHAEEPGNVRMKYVKDYYHAASDGLFTLATPVLAGLGTPTKQFSSCVLIKTDDNLDSIFASGELMAKYASKRAGIGFEMGRMRTLGSPIRNGEILHTGAIPFLKKWYGDLRSCSQGGIRNASCTVYYPIWNLQFQDLIVLKNNQGTDETRVRHMDYAVVLSALFWRRFKNKENITFFDPNDVPDLYEAFYTDDTKFEELYTKYEKKKSLRKMVMSAEEVFKNGVLKERTDTGRIYIMNTDNVMAQGPFDPKYHPIYQSNLCCITGDTLVTLKNSTTGEVMNISVDKLCNDTAFDAAFEKFGDWLIKSYDSTGIVWEEMSNIFYTKHETAFVHISFENTNSSVLKCTTDHRVFTRNRGYVEAAQLIPHEDVLLDMDGNERSDFVLSTVQTSSAIPVYDITVPDTQCFFANGILVHNCEIVLPTKPFNRIDPEKKLIRVKKTNTDEFLKNKPIDFVNMRKL